MPKIKIFCKVCQTELGSLFLNKFMFDNMKQLSKVEQDDNKLNVKCRTCNNWQTFSNSNQETNLKRKSEETLGIN